MGLREYLLSRKRETYQKDDFDRFLKKIKFSYNIPSIHIAGSNGKGSTATYILYIYTYAGYKVGLFTSPYNVSPTEMVRINNVPISEDKYQKYLNEYKKEFEKFGISEFEIETFIAFKCFEDEKCDIAVIECGLGGEYDATNIFTPILSIITSISLEHTSSLGKSLSEIALHKAGIIKEEVPILVDRNLDEEALNVITDVAKENDAPIKLVQLYNFEKIMEDGYHFTYGTLDDLVIKTKAKYSLKDASFAIESTRILEDKYHVSENALRDGLKNMYIQARFEIKKENPYIIIDGGHNPEGIKALIEDVELLTRGHPISIVFACFNDKNIQTMLSDLSVLSSDITLTTFDHPRARQKEEYFLYLDEYKFLEDHTEVIKQIISEKPENNILICGSLAFAYLVSDEFNNNEYKENNPCLEVNTVKN